MYKVLNSIFQMEILRFISAVFYGGPDVLQASGQIPSVVEITPLMFYAVFGKEVQDRDSTSFYNAAEANEVVERVLELLDHWPQEWGPVAPEEIGIVTPYHDQVGLVGDSVFIYDFSSLSCSLLVYITLCTL